MIIGVGNPHRGDDAAGREVARRLGKYGKAEIVETLGEATALLGLMDNASVVFLIDACVSGAEAGAICRVDLAQSPLPDARFGLSSHGFGLSEAVALASALGVLPKRCVLYAIEGQCFDIGSAPSPAVLEAVDRVVEALKKEIDPL